MGQCPRGAIRNRAARANRPSGTRKIRDRNYFHFASGGFALCRRHKANGRPNRHRPQASLEVRGWMVLGVGASVHLELRRAPTFATTSKWALAPEETLPFYERHLRGKVLDKPVS